MKNNIQIIISLALLLVPLDALINAYADCGSFDISSAIPEKTDGTPDIFTSDGEIQDQYKNLVETNYLHKDSKGISKQEVINSINKVWNNSQTNCQSRNSQSKEDQTATDLSQASNALSGIDQERASSNPTQGSINWCVLIILLSLFLWVCKVLGERGLEELKKYQGDREKWQREREKQRERQQREQEELNRRREWERQRKEGAQKQEEMRKRRDQDGHKTPYEILGVSTNATAEEIRRAYKKKALENHPDRTAGLGEEYRLLAEKRMKEINEAYEKLKKV